NLGNAHFLAAEWQAAIAAYYEASSRDSSDVNVWNNLGSAQIKAKAFAEARQSLEQGLKIAPTHAGLIGNFAFLLCQLGQKQDAAEWLQQRLSINPNVAEAWIKLGEVWQMMGEVGLAEEAYRRALSIAPENHEARYQLARMLREQRRFSAAESIVRQLLTAAPDHTHGWSLL